MTDLRRLWTNGIKVCTPRYPQGALSLFESLFYVQSITHLIIGRLLRVALVALVCDKPAAHKIAGYGPTSCTKFCTVCKVTLSDLKTPAAFVDGGTSSLLDLNSDQMLTCIPAFPPRTDQEQRALGEVYLRVTQKTARATFITENATRWTQLSRLPYFDLVRQVVIDPMHNLYLGEYHLSFHTTVITYLLYSRTCQESFLRDMDSK